MKRKQFVILGCIFFILFSAKVFAGEGPYLGFQVSSVFLNDAALSLAGSGLGEIEMQNDAGIGFGITTGYDFGTLRLEGEFEYRRNDVDGFSLPAVSGRASELGSVSALSFLLNGFLDIETGSPLVPYFGGGIGIANIRWEDISFMTWQTFDDNDTVLAYQFVAGVGIAINESVTMDFSYCYFATADPSFDWSYTPTPATGETDSEYKSHNVSFGVRYNFQ